MRPLWPTRGRRNGKEVYFSAWGLRTRSIDRSIGRSVGFAGERADRGRKKLGFDQKAQIELIVPSGGGGIELGEFFDFY